MIIAKHRDGGGKVNGLTQPDEGARRHKLPESSTQPRHSSHQTPEQAAAQNESFSGKTIPCESCNGRRKCINPHEGTPDQTKLHLAESEIPLQQRKEAADRLPVGIVKQTDAPEHPQHHPFFTTLATESIHERQRMPPDSR